MTTYLIPGLLGLLTGLILHWGRFSQTSGLRAALGLRRSLTLRTSLTALGWGILLTALLMWLAVIDVDAVPERFLIQQAPTVDKRAMLAEFKETGEIFEGVQFARSESVSLK